jgi:hypothetical protein
MLDGPFIKWDADLPASHWRTAPLPGHHVWVAATVMQNIASQVYEFLNQRGSKIRVFAWQPHHFIFEDRLVNMNGHRWP